MSYLNKAKMLRTKVIQVEPIIEKKSSITKKRVIKSSIGKESINDCDISGWIVLLIIFFLIILLTY